MPCELQLNIRNRSSTEECETTSDFQAVKEKSEERTGIRSGSGSTRQSGMETETSDQGPQRNGPKCSYEQCSVAPHTEKPTLIANPKCQYHSLELHHSLELQHSIPEILCCAESIVYQ
jgi:hypothetical protein